jgi:hypothetical protein
MHFVTNLLVKSKGKLVPPLASRPSWVENRRLGGIRTAHGSITCGRNAACRRTNWQPGSAFPRALWVLGTHREASWPGGHSSSVGRTRHFGERMIASRKVEFRCRKPQYPNESSPRVHTRTTNQDFAPAEVFGGSASCLTRPASGANCGSLCTSVASTLNAAAATKASAKDTRWLALRAAAESQKASSECSQMTGQSGIRVLSLPNSTVPFSCSATARVSVPRFCLFLCPLSLPLMQEFLGQPTSREESTTGADGFLHCFARRVCCRFGADGQPSNGVAHLCDIGWRQRLDFGQ